MLGFLIVFLMIFSIICSFFNENISTISNSALESCSKAVELVIYLSGSMALWGGIMRVAQKAGITSFIGKILSPVTKLLFKGISKNPKAKEAITMNLVANLFGLGNASTPLGISATKELCNENSPFARRNIAMLVVLNTASIQLIPTTIGAIRLSHGASNPFDITLPIIIVSLISTTAGCLAVYALHLKTRRKNEIL